MGLAIINAIEEFDEDNNEKVNMRVDVHSESVNYGIVGTRIFKFDLFSNNPDITVGGVFSITHPADNCYLAFIRIHTQ